MNRFFARSIHRHELINNEVPLRRYFLLVGGALLALLFAIDAINPRQPAIESGNSGPRLPRIRIHSEQKGPDAVVIDTSRPIVAPTLTARVETARTVTSLDQPESENVVQVSPSVKQPDANEPSKAERKSQQHHKVARAHTRQPRASYAQGGADVGAFNGFWMFGQQNARVRDSFALMVPRQRQGGDTRELAWARTEHVRHPRSGWFDTRW